MTDYAVITTLNEGETIGDLVAALVGVGLRVVVVDDCSTDNTVAEAEMAGAMVWENVSRRGIGPSLMHGWRYALAKGARRIVQLDAGGSHQPEAAEWLLAALDVLGADIVVGSRFVPGSHYRAISGRLRPLLSRLAAAACNWATGARIADWTSGYRAFTAEAAGTLLKRQYGAKMHGWQIEVLAQANAEGMRIKEQPITYTAGRSSFGWRVAHEASNSWLHVFFHVGGCTGNKRLSRLQGASLSETTVRGGQE